MCFSKMPIVEYARSIGCFPVGSSITRQNHVRQQMAENVRGRLLSWRFTTTNKLVYQPVLRALGRKIAEMVKDGEDNYDLCEFILDFHGLPGSTKIKIVERYLSDRNLEDKIVFCCSCSELKRSDDCHTPESSSEHWCEDCYCETFSSCDHCGDTVRSDECDAVDGDGSYCEHCRNREYYYWDRDGEWHSEPESPAADEIDYDDEYPLGCDPLAKIYREHQGTVSEYRCPTTSCNGRELARKLTCEIPNRDWVHILKRVADEGDHTVESLPWQAKRGNLPKRISRVCHSMGYKLSPDELTIIGNLASSPDRKSTRLNSSH